MNTIVSAARIPAATGASTGYTMQLVPAHELASLVEPWSALYDSSAEANPFFGPDYLMALAEGPVKGLHWQACVVWAQVGVDGRRMAGFLPISPRRSFLSPLRALQHPYIVGGVPLLDRFDPVAAAEAMLDGLCEHYRRPIMVFDDVRLDWPGAKALLAATERSGRSALVFDTFYRPGAMPQDDRQAVDRSVAKSLRRRRKRLSEAGEWSVCWSSNQDGLAGGSDRRVLDDFLQLEAKGWKGERKTAMASHPETLAFARRAFAVTNTRPGVRYDVLTHKGHAIAANVNLVAHDHAAAVKAAYDEDYAPYSPGLLLDSAVADSLGAEAWTPLLDSVTLPGNPLEKIWLTPVKVGSLALAIDRRKASAEFDMQLGMERLRRRGRELAQDVYKRLR